MTDVLGVRSDERATLCGFLDWYRAVVERKALGLSLEDATRVMTPSGLSPLGIVKHLSLVERDWFCWTFAGADVELPDVGDDNAPTFRVEPADTVESVVAAYRADVAAAREAAAHATSLDALSARPADVYGPVSLRWILVHMLEETARHAGHLDVMREAIDGRTGD